MNILTQYIRDIGLCIGFLTRLPAPTDPRGRRMSEIAWGFPVVGIVTGTVTAVVFAAASWLGMTPFLAAALAAAATLAVTGGFHEDGLADMADGIGGGRDREHRLKIMRDSRIGVFGAVALGLVLLLRIGALSAIAAPGPVALAVVGAAVASRGFMVPLMAMLPAARADGLGARAGRPGRWVTTAAILLSFALVLLLLPATAAVICLAGAATGACAVALLALRRIGGQTGDILGAAQQAGEILALLALAPILSL